MRRCTLSRAGFLLLCFGLWPATRVHAAEPLHLSVPRDLQVVQRHRLDAGVIPIGGEWPNGLDPQRPAVLRGRLHRDGDGDGGWRDLPTSVSDGRFSSRLEAPAGGWYRVELQILVAGEVVATAAVERVGVGEVFVVAGQSNSANHGEERQKVQSGRVVAFDGEVWRMADDPQPGASGNGGSFIPAFGDAMVQRFGVPVGVLACGLGGTSVREWLPRGATFPNPPTVEARVKRRPDGTWESDGEAYANLVRRLKQPGERGFRAVLWHQGESDANQADPTRTLRGALYREYLSRIIRDARRDIGWEVPWFVAQVSYHVPGDESSPDIREAQLSLVSDGLAWSGPDSDALGSAYREAGGKGVHFSGPGLREHGQRWAGKVAAWLEAELKSGKTPPAAPGR